MGSGSREGGGLEVGLGFRVWGGVRRFPGILQPGYARNLLEYLITAVGGGTCNPMGVHP